MVVEAISDLSPMQELFRTRGVLRFCQTSFPAFLALEKKEPVGMS